MNEMNETPSPAPAPLTAEERARIGPYSRYDPGWVQMMLARYEATVQHLQAERERDRALLERALPAPFTNPAFWLCPVCASGHAERSESCEGYIDIPDPELGEGTETKDYTHPIVYRPEYVQRLEAERERVQNAAKAVEEVVGCGDHSCVFKKPTGMGTNGGCRCSRNSIAMGRLAMLYRAALARTPEDGGNR